MTWVLAVLALVGVVLNIKHNRVCFLIWICTNAYWAVIDFKKGIPAQGCLFLVYLGLSIWGLYAWRKKG